LQLSADELDAITQLLLCSGSAALGWRRVRHSPLQSLPAASRLQREYRVCTLRATLNARAIEQVFALLRAAGVEPMLIKGWAAARLYPEKGLRPYGDIDLCVRPEQYALAENALQSSHVEEDTVDLHCGFDDTRHSARGHQECDELFARSRLVPLGDTQVRVPTPEDHLSILCLHFLRHGAWRPLWLCDIAVALEAQPADFDWGRCLGHNRRRADWIACTIGLAHQLLGVEVGDTPVAKRAAHLPAWLIPAVLRQWSQAQVLNKRPQSLSLLHPGGVPAALLRRWPSPLEATMSLNGPFNAWPRLLFQLDNCLIRTMRWLVQLPRTPHEQQ
jgi:hypothetical protein